VAVERRRLNGYEGGVVGDVSGGGCERADAMSDNIVLVDSWKSGSSNNPPPQKNNQFFLFSNALKKSERYIPNRISASSTTTHSIPARSISGSSIQNDRIG